MVLQLEPRPTGQLVLRAQPDLIDAIDRVAASYKITRSESTRALIRRGLQALARQEG